MSSKRHDDPSICKVEQKLRRLYYLAGRLITQNITFEELDEISVITDGEGENEEYSQTFVILTSTGYLAEFFRGMGNDMVLPDIYGK